MVSEFEGRRPTVGPFCGIDSGQLTYRQRRIRNREGNLNFKILAFLPILSS
jgi:hypothetical protein